MIGNGCVMAIGGNEDKRGKRESILAGFVERSGGGDGRIVIIPSASIMPEQRSKRYTRLFTRLGAADVRTLYAERSVTSAEREHLRNATGIFVTGGNQARLMEFLRSAECVQPIRDAVRDGAVYAGTSAGASALSGRMIASSTRSRRTDIVEFGEGLGLIPHAIIDQHFGERRRLSRLITAANAHCLTGIGIDENTALVWNRDGMMTVEGSGEVTIVNPDDCVDADARAYRLQILKPGSRVVAG